VSQIAARARVRSGTPVSLAAGQSRPLRREEDRALRDAAKAEREDDREDHV